MSKVYNRYCDLGRNCLKGKKTRIGKGERKEGKREDNAS